MEGKLSHNSEKQRGLRFERVRHDNLSSQSPEPKDVLLGFFFIVVLLSLSAATEGRVCERVWFTLPIDQNRGETLRLLN